VVAAAATEGVALRRPHDLALVRRIEQGSSRALFGASDLVASESEVAQFEASKRAALGQRTDSAACSAVPMARFREYGAGRTHADLYGEADSSSKASHGKPGKARSAATMAKASVLEALTRVGLFASLGREELLAVQEAMVESHFAAGESVYEQGADGDGFFVIVHGRAKALRTEPPSMELPVTKPADEDDDEDAEPPVWPPDLPHPGLRCNRALGEETICLCELEAGAFFGEGALLHEGNLRYASVVALTHLCTMAITRQQLEAVVGRQLHTQ